MVKRLSALRKKLRENKDILWHGRGRTWSGFMKFVWGVLRLYFAQLLWGTAVRLAHFHPPAKTLGVVMALVSVLLIVWAFLGLGQALLTLGIKRSAIVLILVYALIVMVNVLTIPDGRPFATRLLIQLKDTGHLAWDILVESVQSVIRAPDDFLFAYTGQRRPPRLPPGFPTPNPDATPIQAVAAPIGNAPSPAPTPTQLFKSTSPSKSATPPPAPTRETEGTRLQVGGYALVADTDGQPLRARAKPGTDSETITRFPEGARLLILDGPESAGEFTWWKVRGEQGEGWCADQWLVPTK